MKTDGIDYIVEEETVYKRYYYNDLPSHIWVRDDGIIFCRPHNRFIPRKLWTNNVGYLMVGGTIESKHFDQLVHLIVWDTFFGPDKRKNLMISHIDCNKENNSPDNLKAVSRKAIHQKIRDSVSVAVIITDPQGNKKEYSSVREAAKALKVHATHITAVKNRRYGNGDGYYKGYFIEPKPINHFIEPKRETK